MGATEESEWSLGWIRRDDGSGEFQITVVRELDPDEHRRFFDAERRLSRLNLPAMFSVLGMAFEALQTVLDNQVKDGSALQNEPALRYLIQYQVTAALAAFSYYRADTEEMVAELNLPVSAKVRQAFAEAHSQDRHWRLLAQLRNIDQHHPSAVRHMAFRAEVGEKDGEVKRDFYVDVAGLIEYARRVSGPTHLKQWDQLEQLWVGRDQEVAFGEVVKHALDRNFQVSVDALLSLEDVLRDDVFTYLTLAQEVDGEGNAIVLKYSKQVDLNVRHHQVDVRKAGLVALSINEARKQKGLPPRFHVAKHGDGYSFTEFVDD